MLYLVQEDIKKAQKYYNRLKSRDIAHILRKIEVIPNLKDLLEVRMLSENKEKANMLLLLIIAGL